MYMWLPFGQGGADACSAYLHGASMVKVGVRVRARFRLYREIPEIVGWVAIIDAMVTMLFWFHLCTCRKRLKRLLAFSTMPSSLRVLLVWAFRSLVASWPLALPCATSFNHAFAKTCSS